MSEAPGVFALVMMAVLVGVLWYFVTKALIFDPLFNWLIARTRAKGDAKIAELQRRSDELNARRAGEAGDG